MRDPQSRSVAPPDDDRLSLSRRLHLPPKHATRSHQSAIALSGGGFRAALYHLGGLRRLNELGLLSRLTTITSVSGGSIVNAALALAWPTLRTNRDGVFTNFAERVEAPVRRFCSHDHRTGPLLVDRVRPWRRADPLLVGYNATHELGQEYREHLVGELTLAHLAKLARDGGPRVVIGASSLKTGAAFLFGPKGVGGWYVGQAPILDIRLCQAIAASSAYPLAFAPMELALDASRFVGGYLPDGLDKQRYRELAVLTDGGVYDNLALEPVWQDHGLLLSSDGGAPFAFQDHPKLNLVSRTLRTVDIFANQALALRKRWLIANYLTGVYQGGYWGLATDIEDYPVHGLGYSGELRRRILAVRTDLDVFAEAEQLILMNHGWTMSDAAVRSFMGPMLPESLPAGELPSRELFEDTEAALAALANSHSPFRWVDVQDTMGRHAEHAPPSGSGLRVVHALQGRLRVRHAGLKGQVDRCERWGARAAQIDGVRSARADVRTGSLLVHFDPSRLSRDTLLSQLSMSEP